MPPLQGLADHHQEGVGRRPGLLIAGLDAQDSLRDEAIDEFRVVILWSELKLVKVCKNDSRASPSISATALAQIIKGTEWQQSLNAIFTYNLKMCVPDD